MAIISFTWSDLRGLQEPNIIFIDDRHSLHIVLLDDRRCHAVRAAAAAATAASCGDGWIGLCAHSLYKVGAREASTMIAYRANAMHEFYRISKVRAQMITDGKIMTTYIY